MKKKYFQTESENYIRDIGKDIINSVPLPTSDSTVIFPLWSFIIEYVIDKPKPVPEPTALVEKKGSNI
ncbi:MAG: hypothetical protein V4549_04025 [Bacteroidota bacterium]